MMSINATPTETVIRKGEPLEFVEDFTYPGNIISKDNGALKRHQSKRGKKPYLITEWIAVLASD